MNDKNYFPADWIASHKIILDWNKKKNNLKKAQEAYERHKKSRIKALKSIN